ncbi:hypothetical protein C0995_009990 [Termitomyces sp. Mi166|nr:hypothetical protein C0995_009990 [Termitomyces sp. Mi166\
MVLRKREREGEIVPASPSSTAPELPPVKKVRTKSSDTSMKASSSQPAPTAMSTGSHVPPTASGLMEPGPSRPRNAARTRRKADPDVPPPEKRGARFKNSCPQNILDRVERVMSQRFFMIDRQREPGDLKESFSVLGSTGNVRTHSREITANTLALLTTELEQIFAEAPLAPNAFANPQIREAHARAMGKATGTPDAQSSSKRRIPGSDDDCPICYEGMHGVGETLLTFCEECGNALHKQCFEQWKTASMNSGKDLTCVFCRARWAVSSAGVGSRVSREGYINLASVSGISPIRDTSTCTSLPATLYVLHHDYYAT